MYKLIAMDLDGTLLDDNKDISKENLIFIDRAIKTGYEIVIATGRGYSSAKNIIQKIDNHVTILANNGNIVKHSFDDRVIISKYLDKEDFKNVVRDGKKRKLDPIIHLDGYSYNYDIAVEHGDDYLGYYNYLKNSVSHRRIKNLDEIEEGILAVVYPGKSDQLNSFYRELMEKYPGVYSAHVIENMEIAEAFLEVMNPDGTKWLSLVEYASNKGIKPEEIIAIGDNNNDTSMIKGAGLGIAMVNGSDALKRKADIITAKDNNESGLAFELRRILKI